MRKFFAVLMFVLAMTVYAQGPSSGLPPAIFLPTATGSVNALAAAQPGATLTAGQLVMFTPNNANTTTTPTLALNGLTAKTITKYGQSALAAGDLTTSAIAVVVYDGTDWELQNPQTSNSTTTFGGIGSGTNSSATMTIGTGGTITFSGSGVVNASTLNSQASSAFLVKSSGGSSQTITNTGSGLFAAENDNNRFKVSGFPSSCSTTQGSFTSQLECAWFQSYDFAVTNTAIVKLDMGFGYYTITHSLYEPVQNFTGISLEGTGPQSSVILVNGVLTDAPIYKNETTSGGALPNLSFKDFKIQGNNNTYMQGGCMRIWGVQELKTEHLNCINVPGGATGNAPFLYQWGEPSNYLQGWVFQHTSIDVIGGNTVTQPSTPATITPSVSGGNLTLAITNGGAGYISNGIQIPYLVVMGNQGGTSDQPCTVPPTAPVITLTGGVITGLTFTGGTGCGAASGIEASVVAVSNIAIGMDTWSTDSDLWATVPLSTILGIRTHGGNTRLSGAHPTKTIIGIQNFGNDTIEGGELDSGFQWGMDFQQGSPYANGTTVSGMGTFANAPNFAVYHFNATSTVEFGVQGNLCTSTSTNDFHEFLGPTGTVEHTGWSVLNGGGVNGNDTTCSAIALGDYAGTMTIKKATITGPAVFSAAGAASTPALSITGALPTGTGTTAVPQLYLNSGGTPPTDWSGGTTEFGINAASGFTGDFARFHVNGAAAAWQMNSTGTVIATGSYTVGAANGFVFNGRTKLISPADSQLGISNNGGTGFARLIFGNAALATFPAFCMSGTTITACLGDNSANSPFVASTLTDSSVTNAFIVGTNGSGLLVGNQLFAANAQTATYQAVAADFIGCKTIPVASGTFVITLVASGSQPASGQCIDIINYGTGVVTITRSGQNINGGVTSLTLPASSATSPSGAHIVSDGTNYEAALYGGTSSGSAFSALTGATNTTAAMVVGTGASLATSGSGTIAATTTANLAGTGVDYAPYQSASGTTSYITAPTTSGHVFVYAWQPSGSAVAPTAFDLGTYLASPPAIGGTVANAGTFTTVTTSPPSGDSGMLALPGNSIYQACPANQFCIAGFNTAAATAYGWAPGATAPAANNVVAIGAPTSGWAPITYISNATTVNGQTCTLGSTCSTIVATPTPLTAQVANVSSTTIYTTPAATHYYQVCMTAELTRAATTSSALVGMQVAYTSGVDTVVKVANLGFNALATTNATFTQNSGCVNIFVAASTNIQWATVGYASTGATTMQYDLSATVELLK